MKSSVAIESLELNDAPLSVKDDTSVLANALVDLGVSGPEQTVLLNLLRNGSRPVSSIAKQTRISRAHIYELLDRLQSRGLVSIHERQGVRYFSAIPLDEIIFLFEQREESLASRRRELADVMRESHSSSKPSLFSDPRTQGFRGAEARARLFQELTRGDSGRVLLFCSAHQSTLFDGINASKEALMQLTQLISGELWIIVHSSGQGTPALHSNLRDSLDSQQAIQNVRLAITDQELPSEMLVSGGRVMVLGTRGGMPHAIVFEQPALAATLQQMGSVYFDKQ